MRNVEIPCPGMRLYYRSLLIEGGWEGINVTFLSLFMRIRIQSKRQRLCSLIVFIIILTLYIRRNDLNSLIRQSCLWLIGMFAVSYNKVCVLRDLLECNVIICENGICSDTFMSDYSNCESRKGKNLQYIYI